MSATTAEVTVRKVDAKPTVPQIYRIARELCSIAGVEFPETRGAASALIGTLLEQSAAVAAQGPDAIEREAGF
jgi:hypothetical protein